MRRALAIAAGLGLLVVAGSFLLGEHEPARSALLLLAGLSALVSALAATLRPQAAHRAFWLVLAAALGALVVADTVRSASLLGTGDGHGPEIHASYALAYPLLSLALLLLLRRLAAGDGRELALDGGILGIGAALVLWPYLFEPRLGGSGLAGAWELVQPLGAVVALAALGGAIVSSGRLVPAERLFVAALAALFAGDVAYVARHGDAVLAALGPELPWTVAYVLLVASALHPSARDLGRPRERAARSPRRRLAVVATAGLVAPALALAGIATGELDATVVAVGMGLFTALVVARLALLVAEIDRLRRRAELSEGRLRMVFEASPIGICLPPDDDPLSGRLAYTNRSFQEMLGYGGDELARLHWQDVTLPDGREEDARLLQELLGGLRQSYRLEKTYLRRDGSTFPAEVNVALARGEDGTPRLAVGLVEDVSERRRVEQELVESEQRFRDLLGGIEAMVWECRVGDWGYTFVSGGVEQLLGYPVAHWLADPDFWITRLHPADRERVVACARAGELSGEGWAIEYRLLHADGHAVWVRDVVRVVLGADGLPERLRGVMIDITASKDAEDERNALRDHLRQKQKVEALGELAGGVAHDFNNLLTAIGGYVELALRRAGDDSKLRRHLEEIGRSSERAAALTRQLLAFGRRQLLSPRVVDLNEVVRGMGELVRRLVGDAVELRLELDEAGPRVEADPNQLEQVIMNLAVNARDAMPGGGTLTIRTGSRTVEGEEQGAQAYTIPAGSYALLSVADTGAGMAEDVRRRAFDPFFTTKADGAGTGLGLSMVYGIVRQSGGHVDLESAPGRGTVATVLLPLTRAEVAELRAPVSAPAPVAAVETILLVEDEPAVRHVIEAALEDAGFRVVTAVDGLDALDVVAAYGGPIDVVLSDVSMPRLGGLQLAERLADVLPAARILLMTGYADSVPAGLPLLRKPFGFDELLDAVRGTLAERQPQAA